jgi:hypothetical protein
MKPFVERQGVIWSPGTPTTPSGICVHLCSSVVKTSQVFLPTGPNPLTTDEHRWTQMGRNQMVGATCWVDGAFSTKAWPARSKYPERGNAWQSHAGGRERTQGTQSRARHSLCALRSFAATEKDKANQAKFRLLGHQTPLPESVCICVHLWCSDASAGLIGQACSGLIPPNSANSSHFQ